MSTPTVHYVDLNKLYTLGDSGAVTVHIGFKAPAPTDLPNTLDAHRESFKQRVVLWTDTAMDGSTASSDTVVTHVAPDPLHKSGAWYLTARNLTHPIASYDDLKDAAAAHYHPEPHPYIAGRNRFPHRSGRYVTN